MTQQNGAPARKRSLTEEMRDAEIGIPSGPDANPDRDLHGAFRDGLCRRDAWCVEPSGHSGTCTTVGARELGPAKVPTRGMAVTSDAKAPPPPEKPWPDVGAAFVDVTDLERELLVTAVNMLDRAQRQIDRDIVGVVTERCQTVLGTTELASRDYSCSKKVFDAIWTPKGSTP